MQVHNTYNVLEEVLFLCFSVNNELLIEIKQVRERRREKGGARRVLSYIAYFENNVRQRVTKRVFEKWLERKEVRRILFISVYRLVQQL